MGSTIQDSSFLSKFCLKLFVTTRDRGASGGHIKNHTRSLNYGLVRIGPDINGKAITSRWSGFFFPGGCNTNTANFCTKNLLSGGLTQPNSYF